MTSAAPAATILVVDDEVLVRMIIAEYLRHCGYRVIEAVNAEEAMVVLEHDETIVDVVLSDVEMRGAMDGFALRRWIRDKRPDVQVVLVGNPQGAAQAAGDLCESGPLLNKPYEPQAVADRISLLLAQRAARTKQ